VLEDISGERLEERLRAISDEIVALRSYIDEEPANEILIGLLEQERNEIWKVVRCLVIGQKV
jgi:hypothetical protein